MDIDIYQQCPCHAEKKIKFCCGKNIVSDLNQVLAKNRAGQPIAALDQIERSIKKHGAKDCLLTIKTHILMANNELEKAQEVNDQFLATNPDDSSALHHRAMLHVENDRIAEAVESLQDAMDAIKGNEIPVALANGFRIVGIGLHGEGLVAAAKAHWAFAMSLKNSPESQQLLSQFQSDPSVPLVMRQSFMLDPPIEDVPWEKKYRNVSRALDRGQFRKALQFLKQIDQAYPGQTIVIRAIAIVNGFLGRRDDMLDAWRAYQQIDGISKLQIVETEAICQCYDDRPSSMSLNILRSTYELSDVDQFFEIATAEGQLVQVGRPEIDPLDEGPPPRWAFGILDREKLDSAENLTFESLPELTGEVLVYGKQTDRPARAEIVSPEGKAFETIQTIMDEKFSATFVGQPTVVEVGQTTQAIELFDWQWHLPENVTRQQHQEWLDAKQLDVLVNQWPQLKFTALNNKTPAEAANDPALEIPLRALILQLDGGASFQVAELSAGQLLLEKFGLEDYEEIADPSPAMLYSPVLARYFNYQTLDPESMATTYQQATLTTNRPVIRTFLLAALERSDLDELPRGFAYITLAYLVKDEQQALEYFAKAREEATKVGQTHGMLYVQEFEFRFSRGITEGLTDILDLIKNNHIDEPNVELELIRCFDRFGLSVDQSSFRNQGPPQPPASNKSQIWLPDS